MLELLAAIALALGLAGTTVVEEESHQVASQDANRPAVAVHAIPPGKEREVTPVGHSVA